MFSDFTIFWNWVSTSICAAHLRKTRTDQWCAAVPGDDSDQGPAGTCWKAELDTSPHSQQQPHCRAFLSMA